MSNEQQYSEVSHDDGERIKVYQQLVAEYEALDQEIDALIMKYDGASKNMPQDVLASYREMARRRSDLRNEMRIMEETLFDED